MRSRLLVYYQKLPSTALRLFESKIKNDGSDSSFYGLALAFARNGNFSKSIEIIEDLIQKYPKNLMLSTTYVEVLLQAEKFQEALLYVNKYLEISPKNYPLSFIKSKILLAMNKYFESEEIIRDQLLRRNDNPDLWMFLSEIQRSSKNIIGYHQSKAEYYILLGQNEEALNQLEFALKLTKNNFQASESIMNKIVTIKESIENSRGF